MIIKYKEQAKYEEFKFSSGTKSKHQQARRVDSVEGGLFYFLEVFFYRWGWGGGGGGVGGGRGLGHAPQESLQMKVLSNAIFCILTSFLRWDAFSFNISSSKSNSHSKKILKCLEMSVCI